MLGSEVVDLTGLSSYIIPLILTVMSTTEEEINPYELLKLESEATEQDIKTSYRKISLKVHPDRVSVFPNI